VTQQSWSNPGRRCSCRPDHPKYAVGRKYPKWRPPPAPDLDPRWGKDMLAVLLRREGTRLSVSMVGRIL
jgi:hypothetical protein